MCDTEQLCTRVSVVRHLSMDASKLNRDASKVYVTLVASSMIYFTAGWVDG